MYKPELMGVRVRAETISRFINWQKKFGVRFSNVFKHDKNAPIPSHLLLVTVFFSFCTVCRYFGDVMLGNCDVIFLTTF